MRNEEITNAQRHIFDLNSSPKYKDFFEGLGSPEIKTSGCEQSAIQLLEVVTNQLMKQIDVIKNRDH